MFLLDLNLKIFLSISMLHNNHALKYNLNLKYWLLLQLNRCDLKIYILNRLIRWPIDTPIEPSVDLSIHSVTHRLIHWPIHQLFKAYIDHNRTVRLHPSIHPLTYPTIQSPHRSNDPSATFIHILKLKIQY